MIDVSEVILDPDFAQDFVVTRSAGGEFGEGGWQEGVPTSITMRGVVTVMNEKELAQIPEGDRVKGAMAFYSTEELYVTRASGQPGTSDIITWRGEQYKVVSVAPHVDYGFYMAMGVRMAGN